ncbi:MAG: NADH-quinone oxidoreductase subunit NuoE [Planctomycetota bacterium]
MTTTEQTLEDIFNKHPHAHRDSLIPILQETQKAFGFLSRESVVAIGRHLDLPTSKIYGVATFYNQFRFQGIGKYYLQICRGTACHVKGSAGLLAALKRELKVDEGQTTRDGLFTLDVVACIGACGLAPVININGEFHARMTPDAGVKLIRDIRKKEEAK